MIIGKGGVAITHKMLLFGFVNVNKYDPNMQKCSCWDGLPCNAHFCNPNKWGRVSDELLEQETKQWIYDLAEDRSIREMENFYPYDCPDKLREWRASA